MSQKYYGPSDSHSDRQRELLAMLLAEEGVEAAQAILPRPQSDRAPVSFAQQRMWFLDQLEPDSPLYNVPRAVRLEGRLEVRALEQSFDEIMRRHESLRTTFELDGCDPVQIIHPPRSEEHTSELQ